MNTVKKKQCNDTLIGVEQSNLVMANCCEQFGHYIVPHNLNYYDQFSYYFPRNIIFKNNFQNYFYEEDDFKQNY